MLKYYLLFGVCCMIYTSSFAQSGQIYASTSKHQAIEPLSLKRSLSELEKKFNVSIAYKDEWVENKLVDKSIKDFSTIEEALQSLITDTDLYFEKAGDRFYVVSLKSLKKEENEGQESSFDKQPEIVSESPINNAINVSGKVSEENNAVLPGVNILVKGTTNGTTTDSDGRYSITVDDADAVLIFSFIGYVSQEIAVGSRSIVDVVMLPDVKALEEVVVTALGIEKSAKSLGYATSKVTSDQFALNRTPNIMNALQGKIAGVNISSLGTGPGGSSKIRIRGQSSIGGQNTPLIVLNGVPIDNTNFGTNQGNAAGDNSVANNGSGASSDGGDGLSSINPDDVENMTILKGAAAAALYGSRAKDGVIMITTKSRNATKGMGVTYNMNFTDEAPLDYTDYQYVYGQGENGIGPASPNAPINPTTGQWSWGSKIQPGMNQVLFNNVIVPYTAQKGILNQFYRHGQNLSNTISLSTSSDKGGMNLSLSNLSSDGITPNNSFTRKTINLGFNYDLTDKLSFKGNINYANEYNKNPPIVSDQDNSAPTALYAMANTLPLDVLNANKYNAGGGEYLYSRFTNRTNPYWGLAELKQNIRRDRIFGNISLKYNITKWLFVQGRLGQDYWSRDQDYINLPTGKANLNNGSILSSVAGYYNGVFTQDTRRFRETNADFLVSATKEFGDFGVNATVGGNQMYRRSDDNNVQVTDFVVKGLYTVQNGRAKVPNYDLSERAVNSLYGSAEISYKRFLFLNGTVRNDWFSTLSPANRSILYPSVSASYVFSESFESIPSWLTFGKLRAAYAEAGSDSDVGPYANNLYYGVNGNTFGGQAVGNFGASVPNGNLRPMHIGETELGLELKMLDNRVGVDLAVYRKLTTDQIVNAQISDGSGFTSTKINSGQSENKGIEMMINIVPIKNSDLQWDFTFTGAYNVTKVLSLLTSTPGENITVGTHVFNGFVQQVVGEELGQIVGYGYRRDDGSKNQDHKGMIVYGANGLALPSAALMRFGSALPKWVGGFTNTLNYKGLSFSFLIDFKLGGKVLSGTNFNAYRHGLSKETLPGRDGGTIDANGNDPGKVIGDGVDINSNINAAGAQAESYYSVVRASGIVEPVIYDAGYWKLRQISIGYDFTRFFKGIQAVKGVRLNFVANNILMLKKWVPNIDPESFSYTSDNVVGLESPSLPTTRSIGFNLNVKF